MRVLSRVINTLEKRAITHTLLLSLLISIHEPPSRVSLQILGVTVCGVCGWHLGFRGFMQAGVLSLAAQDSLISLASCGSSAW